MQSYSPPVRASGTPIEDFPSYADMIGDGWGFRVHRHGGDYMISGSRRLPGGIAETVGGRGYTLKLAWADMLSRKL